MKSSHSTTQLLRTLARLQRYHTQVYSVRLKSRQICGFRSYRYYSSEGPVLEHSKDPRTKDLGREIVDEYARLRDHYDAPKHTIVLAHGLLGFSKLRLPGNILPPVHYWFGIEDALMALKDVNVIATSVPASGSLEQRVERLENQIASQVEPGQGVNIIAHSMGGLDSRLLIHSKPTRFKVRSLVTIGTPHRGSSFADIMLERIGEKNLTRIYDMFERATGLDTGAFEQLTTKYMKEKFNPTVTDDPDVKYFSYGAAVQGKPPLFSPFRLSHKLLMEREGRNDGLVSLKSSRWGEYKGTLAGVNHLELINWTNRLRYTVKGWMGQEKKFNAVALYLDIADMLSKEGL